jgi:hypothetical protein
MHLSQRLESRRTVVSRRATVYLANVPFLCERFCLCCAPSGYRDYNSFRVAPRRFDKTIGRDFRGAYDSKSNGLFGLRNFRGIGGLRIALGRGIVNVGVKQSIQRLLTVRLRFIKATAEAMTVTTAMPDGGVQLASCANTKLL